MMLRLNSLECPLDAKNGMLTFYCDTVSGHTSSRDKDNLVAQAFWEQSGQAFPRLSKPGLFYLLYGASGYSRSQSYFASLLDVLAPSL